MANTTGAAVFTRILPQRWVLNSSKSAMVASARTARIGPTASPRRPAGNSRNSTIAPAGATGNLGDRASRYRNPARNNASPNPYPIPRKRLGRTSRTLIGMSFFPWNLQKVQPGRESSSNEGLELVDAPVNRQKCPLNGAIPGGNRQVRTNGGGSASGSSGRGRDISDQKIQLGSSIS